jgi:hypothetical protein
MKTKFYTSNFFVVMISCFIIQQSLAQTNTFPSTGALGIGTTTPNNSSLLEIKSTTKGAIRLLNLQ